MALNQAVPSGISNEAFIARRAARRADALGAHGQPCLSALIAHWAFYYSCAQELACCLISNYEVCNTGTAVSFSVVFLVFSAF